MSKHGGQKLQEDLQRAEEQLEREAEQRAFDTTLKRVNQK